MTQVSPWFLVWSNLGYWLPIAVLVYKSRGNRTHFIQEMSLFVLVWIASSGHHLCDTDAIGICMRSKSVMYAFDLFFSYVAITGAFSAFYAGDLAKIYLSYVFIGPLLIVYLFNDSYEGAIILVVMTVVCFVACQLRYTLRHLCQLVTYATASFMIAFAIWCKLRGDRLYQNPQNYVVWHSMWHLMSAVAAAVLITAVPHIDVLTSVDLTDVINKQSRSMQHKLGDAMDSSTFSTAVSTQHELELV